MPFVGHNIRRIRLERGMTQKELAELTGYDDNSAISRIENGKHEISNPQVRVFADALKVDVSEIMEAPTISARDLVTINRKLEAAQKEIYTLQLALGADSVVEKRIRLWDAYDNAPKTIQEAVDRLLAVD